MSAHKIELEVLIAVREAFRQYELEVFDGETALDLPTKETCVVQARQFIKWLGGEYELPRICRQRAAGEDRERKPRYDSGPRTPQ